MPTPGVLLISGTLGNRDATYKLAPLSVDRPLTKLHGYCGPKLECFSGAWYRVKTLLYEPF